MNGSLYFLIVVFTFILFIDQSFGKGKDNDKKKSPEGKSDFDTHTVKQKFNSGVAKLNEIKSKVVPGKTLSKETHPTIWDKFADTFLNDLKSTLPSTCVSGVRVENTQVKQVLTLTKGKLTGINQLYHINDASVVTETPNSVEIEIKLAFINLKIEYFYEYEAKTLIFSHRKSRGPVVLQVDGVSVFSVNLDIKKLSADNSEKNKQCYFNVKNMKLTEIPSKVKMIRVHSNNIITRTFYFILKYLNLTVRGVTSSVKVVQEQIMKYVGEALEEAVQKSLSTLKGVCPGELVKKKTPRDCKLIKPILY